MRMLHGVRVSPSLYGRGILDSWRLFMACLDQRDVREILQTLEEGIRFMPRIATVEKMKMRRRIRKQFNWLLELNDPTAEMIFYKLEERLPDVFPLYHYGFRERLRKLLEEKLPGPGSI